MNRGRPGLSGPGDKPLAGRRGALVGWHLPVSRRPGEKVMGKILRFRRRTTKPRDPMGAKAIGKGRPVEMGVWAADAEVKRLENELDKVSRLLMEASLAACEKHKESQNRGKEVHSYRAMVRALALQNHQIRKINGQIMQSAAKAQARAQRLEERNRDLIARNARLCRDADQGPRFTVASLWQIGFGSL